MQDAQTARPLSLPSRGFFGADTWLPVGEPAYVVSVKQGRVDSALPSECWCFADEVLGEAFADAVRLTQTSLCWRAFPFDTVFKTGLEALTEDETLKMLNGSAQPVWTRLPEMVAVYELDAIVYPDKIERERTNVKLLIERVQTPVPARFRKPVPVVDAASVERMREEGYCLDDDHDGNRTPHLRIQAKGTNLLDCERKLLDEARRVQAKLIKAFKPVQVTVTRWEPMPGNEYGCYCLCPSRR
jgi:hypothetical protein